MSIIDSKVFADSSASTLRVVVIIGASGGIGRALLESYRGENVALYLTANGRYDELLELAATSRDDYPFLRAYRVALDDAQAVRAFVDAMLRDVANDCNAAWLRVDDLAFCSGIDLMTADNCALDFDARLARAWQIDVAATIHIARRIGRFMRDARRARGANARDGGILFFSWDGVARGRAGETSAIYATCKGALSGYARSLAQDLAPEVRVNTIAPGWIQTRWGDSTSDGVRARLQRDSLEQRWGEPREIAALARFLLSEKASYVNGQTIDANGGYAYSRAREQE